MIYRVVATSEVVPRRAFRFALEPPNPPAVLATVGLVSEVRDDATLHRDTAIRAFWCRGRVHLCPPTEGFCDTAVAMPFKFELRKILPPEGGLNKRQRCAEGLA